LRLSEPDRSAWVPTCGLPIGREMDCRQFRRAHTSFLDDTLSGVETITMRAHLSDCLACADLDFRLRRALMLARSAPSVSPSAGFSARLAARIASERALAPPPALAKRSSRARTAAASASVLFLAVAASATIQAAARPAPAPLLSLAPVVVRPPAIPAEPVAAPAMFATVTSSLPVYPAVLLARRATEHFAATHARAVTFQASR
jgi:hypothetical protein